MDHTAETIAAIATAPGTAGIAIVRVSGPRSLAVADRIVRCAQPVPSCRPSSTFFRAHVVNPDLAQGVAAVDEAIVLIYRAPHSYTREDVVEIQGHGGRACAGRILEAALDAGARPAEPGEFTKRAFLNGRIDLLQAEAVMDIIQARGERAAKAALEQLDGCLSIAFKELYDCLISTSCDLEATLDFEEGELPEGVRVAILAEFRRAAELLERLDRTWEEGRVLREGALVVISGRPNVGKSTLLNRLLGTERSIVTDVPGTTRDSIEEALILDGIPLRLVDTAGVRESDCKVEREGVRRASALAQRADLLLTVVDASVPMEPAERMAVERVGPRKQMVVLNKVDLGRAVREGELAPIRTVSCSLLTGSGVATLCDAIVSHLGVEQGVEPHAVLSARHRQLVQGALTEVRGATEVLDQNGESAAVLAANHVRAALERVGLVTGRVYTEELLDGIFGRFCVGK